jgi:nitrite reductase/ring-hydroxylating ferredoxin subunit
MTEYYVGDIEEFPEGKAKSVSAGGIDVAICHVDGKYYGLSNLCPHRNYKLTANPDYPDDGNASFREVNGELCVECPWHYLTWNLQNGENAVTHQSIGSFDVEVRDEDVYVVL